MAKNDERKIELVSFEKLHLDKEHNPRLPAKLMRKPDSEILEYMILEANVLDLMESIGEKGFFYGEPILVVPAEKKGEYTVVEGNRRLSAVMLLNDPNLTKVKHKLITQISENAKHKPKELPIVQYASRDEILDYLGYRHITGIKEWDALAKAKYLRQLYDKSAEGADEQKFRELARTIGSRPDYVKKLLCALSIYGVIADEGYFGIKELEDNISFSLITTALGYNNIQKFLGLQSIEVIESKNLNLDNLKELTRWMFDRTEGKTRLGESRNLKQLADIVNNEVALKEFRKGETLEAAFYFSEGAKESVINAIREALKYLELAYRYAKEVTLGDQEHNQLEEIKKTANAIKKQTTVTSND